MCVMLNVATRGAGLFLLNLGARTRSAMQPDHYDVGTLHCGAGLPGCPDDRLPKVNSLRPGIGYANSTVA